MVQSSLGGLAQPVRHHWFYLRPNEKYWIPFSLTDSAHLEEALLRSGGDTSQQVAYACTHTHTHARTQPFSSPPLPPLPWPRYWSPLMGVAMTWTSTSVGGWQCTGRSRSQRCAAACGSTRERPTGGTFLTRKMWQQSWRQVGRKCCHCLCECHC